MFFYRLSIKSIKLFILWILSLAIIASCGGSEADSESGGNEPPKIDEPSISEDYISPKNISVLTGDSSITIGWDHIDHSKNYTVKYRLETETGYTHEKTPIALKEITNLQNDSIYHIKVLAVYENEYGNAVEGPESNIIEVMPTSDASSQVHIYTVDESTKRIIDLSNSYEEGSSFLLVGRDESVFEISGSYLEFKEKPLYEDTVCNYGTSNICELTLIYLENSQTQITINLVINIIDINNTAPSLDDINGEIFYVLESETFVTELAPVDPDTTGETINYTLAGADDSLFEINGNTLSFKNPSQLLSNCGANNTCNISITPNDGTNVGNTVSISVKIYSQDNSYNVNEGDTFVLDLSTEFPGGNNFSLEGEDSALFEINSNILEFKNALDYENPSCSNNLCKISLSYQESTSLQTELLINIIDINDTAPSLNAIDGEVFYVLQNSKFVTDLEPVDPDTTGEAINYTLTGADASLFEVSGNILSFKNPSQLLSNCGADNTCNISITPSDGTNIGDTVDISIEIYERGGINIPPVADAGPDRDETAGSIVTLDGSISYDNDGFIIDYQWTLISNDSNGISLYNENEDISGFIAPNVREGAILEFELKVTDDLGESSTDNVVITIPPSDQNPTKPPKITLNKLPDRKYYIEGDTIIFSSDVAEGDTPIESVTFYIDDVALGSPITEHPFQVRWDAVSANNYILKAVVQAEENFDATSDEVVVEVRNQNAPSDTDNITVTTELVTDGGWSRILINISNSSSESYNMDDAVLIYNIPSSYVHESYTESISGLDWLGSDDLTKVSINKNENTEYQIIFDFSVLAYQGDTNIDPGDSFTIRLSDFNPSIDQSFYDTYIDDKVEFYLKDDIVNDYAELSINLPVRPDTINDKDTVKVYIKNVTTDTLVTEVVAWENSYEVVDLIASHEYEVWAESFMSGTNSLWTPNYNEDAPLRFTASSETPQVADIAYSSSILSERTLTITFDAIPTDADIKIDLINTSSGGRNSSFTLSADRSHDLALLEGSYIIKVESYRNETDTGIDYYSANIDENIALYSDTNLTIPFRNFEFSRVPGLPPYLSMGTITNSSESLNVALESSDIEIIYKYAGPGGNGDRGQIVEPIATKKTVEQARAAERADKKVLPMMVVYTAEASGGGWAEEDIANYDNLVKHNINLIRIVRELQSNKDEDYPIAGGIIHNPDFLGVIMQSGALDDPDRWKDGLWHGSLHELGTDPVPGGMPVRNTESLLEAIEYVVQNDGAQEIDVPVFEDTFYGYLQMQNYIIRAYGPDVIFGWQQNLWAPGTSQWIHTVRNDTDRIKEIGYSVANFMKRTGAYEGLWKPDFLVFDKYERDGFGNEGRLYYAFNHNDWSNYLEFVRYVGEGMDDIPLVIWQIPGGHMHFASEPLGSYNIDKHSASAAQYFFGDSNLTSLDLLHEDFKSIPLGNGNQQIVDSFYGGLGTAIEYLNEAPVYDWTQNHLQRTIDYGVVSILWGGGSTTSVVSLGNTTGDDDGWLNNKVSDYYDNRLPLVRNPVISNSPPLVNAGVDIAVESNVLVNLYGTAIDDDSEITSVLWTNTDGINIDRANSLNAEFVTPIVYSDTEYTFTLTVTDEYGASASDNIVVTVNAIPRLDQNPIDANPSTVQGEEGTSVDVALSGGSGNGSFVAESDNTSIVTAAISDTTMTLNLLSVGNTTVTVKKLGNTEFNDSNFLTINVQVTQTTKLEQTISLSANEVSGIKGDVVNVIVSGARGTGELTADSTRNSIVSTLVNGDNIELSLKARGTAIIKVKKEGDEDYQNSNEISLNVVVSEQESNSDDITMTVTRPSNSVILNFENTSANDIDIRNAVIILDSPVNIPNIDGRVVNSSISHPSVSVVDSTIADSRHHISIKITFDEGDWVDSVLSPGEAMELVYWGSIPGEIHMLDFLLEIPGGSGANNSSLALPVLKDPINLSVSGWGLCMQMGTVTDSSNDSLLINALADSGIRAIFKYEGDGFGDRSDIIDASVTQNTINQAREIETAAGDGRTVMPVMVVYTADGSSGGVAEEDIKNEDNLMKHYVNLIRTANKLQQAKDADHPNPGTIILNPDLLGEWLLNEYRTPNEFEQEYGSENNYTLLPIQSALSDAIEYVRVNDGLSSINIPTDEITNDILGYVQSLNFLIRNYAPDVTFGWQQNIWAVESALWIHERYAGNQHLWDEVSSYVADFMDRIGAYSGRWKPDFLVFDKYEFDGLGGGKGAYAFNNYDWENYLLFVKQVTEHLNTPAMLWQIPGGHLATNGESVSDENILAHSATGGTYFMGDKAIGTDIRSNVKQEVLDITLDPSVYVVNNAGDYLTEDLNYDWGRDRLREAAFSNVFAILWGGGNTTGVVRIPTLGNGYENSWLSDRVQSYYANGCTKIARDTSGSSNGSGAPTEISGNTHLDSALLNDIDSYNNQVLLYEENTNVWVPSTIYNWEDFLIAIKSMHVDGVAEYNFWLGEDETSESEETRAKYGLVSIAAFLAQSMKESIRYNACDENNWTDPSVIRDFPPELVGTTVYPMTSACGQLGQDYASYGDGDPFSCPLNPKMEVSAVTNAKWYGAPGPLFAAPDSALEYEGLLSSEGGTGRWDYLTHCNDQPALEDDFELSDQQVYKRNECEIYDDQKAGRFIFDGSSGSVEGCGWWGRGVIQTTGPANFGRLNHYLGRTHLDQSDSDVRTNYPAPENPLYPNLDLCSNPELICSSTEHPELKWIAGLFYWMSSVQEYDGSGTPYAGWDYRTEVKRYVDGGMNGDSFIDDVSGIVNRGCPDASCDTGSVDGIEDRRENFKTVLRTMGLLNE